MSDENRDPETGQFATAEFATGREALELEAGYTPLKEPESEPELTVEEAAAELLAQDTPESEIKTYSAISEMLEETNASLTIEQAAELLSKEKNADAEAARVADDKAAADELQGISPEAKADEVKPEPEVEAQPVRDGELDPEIEKALSNPKVQAALAQH